MQAPFDFQKLFELSPNPYMLLDRDLRYVTANAAYLRVTASRLEDLVGRYVFEAFPHDPDDPANASLRMLRDSFFRVLNEGVLDTLALIPYRVPRHTEQGVVVEDRFWSATHTPLLDGAGKVAFILQHTMDVTELQQLKQAMREVEGLSSRGPGPQLEGGVFLRAKAVQEANLTLDGERKHLRRLFEAAPGFMCSLRGPDHVFELVNRAYLQLIGHRDILGKPIREALPEVAGQGYFELLDGVLTSGEPFVGHGMRVMLQRVPGGVLEEAFVDLVYQPIVEPDGRVSGIFVQGHDMTAQKRAEGELARHRDHLEELVRERTRALEESEAERRQAEAALLQAQKMEAVGKLTGGVAHDFNNLLSVLSSGLEVLSMQRKDGKDGSPSGADVRTLESMRRAIDRGARLTQQLLAFARQQPLQAETRNLNRIIHGFENVLRRAVNPNIAFVIELDPKAHSAVIDSARFESALLNLVVNARDAMPDGGRLAITSANVSFGADGATPNTTALAPGEYVKVTVVDTGTGMPPEVVARAFEPFFTTKEVGKGTGLGLSQVYGFIKQSGGDVVIASRPGEGSAISVYLPAVVETVSEGEDAHTERVLIVEDETDLMDVAASLFTSMGYDVVTAASGREAIDVLARQDVDILFTDVVMPNGMNGIELAGYTREHYPQTKIMLASGYPLPALKQRHGKDLSEFAFVNKPYRLSDLARTLRSAM
ncbi:MAG: response regulator [Acetobacteraceae bacterium]|nr:MAG: response regulator [Acetobacteraceae bacterium]